MEKIKVLWYGDSPVVQTGFGRVSREILNRLHDTGKYEIIVCGLNDLGEPSEYRSKFKIYSVVDLKEDPYGFKVLPMVIQRENPDVILTLNDIWVYTGFPENNNVDWFKKIIASTKPSLPVVCYFTIDGRPNAPEWDDFIRWVDVPIVMSDYGEQTVLETASDVKNKLIKAYHGSASDYFYPLSQEEKTKAKKEVLGNIPLTDNTYLIGCVSRNQPRKNIPTLLYAFKKYVDGYWICPKCGYYVSESDSYCEICTTSIEEITKNGKFIDGNNNAYLYLHMAIRDARGFKLDRLIRDNKIRHVITGMNHDVAHGVSIDTLNRIYNSFDVFVQPTYAEGYGLPPIEAASAGCAVIATNSTTMVEMFKDGRGELVLPDSVLTLADAGQCRKHNISEKGLVAAFDKLYKNPELRKEYREKAREFALSRTWDEAAKIMDESIQKANSLTVNVDEYFTEKKGQKTVLVNTSWNPEEILSIIPLARALGKDGEVVCIVNDQYKRLLDGFDSINASIGLRHSILRKDVLVKYGARIINTTGAYEKYALAIYPNVDFNSSGFYCNKFGVQSTTKPKLGTTSEESEYVKSMLSKYEGKKTIFVGTSGLQDNIYEFNKWSNVIEIISSIENVVIFTDLVDKKIEKHKDNVVFMGYENIKDQLLIAKNVDYLVTTDNVFLILAEGFNNKKVIALASGSDLKKKYDIDNMIMVANNSVPFNCWPCNRPFGTKCQLSKSEISACINNIQYEEIIGAIIGAIKEE
jgi:glycosyltransferase involved in cell wall biosynthesis